MITKENQSEWIEKASTMTQKQLEKEVAKENPKEAVKEKMTYVQESRIQLTCGISEKLMKDFNKTYFTKIDISDTREIPLACKKAKLITNHATGSYQLTGTGKIEKLVISNPEEFWSASKYLVILVE